MSDPLTVIVGERLFQRPLDEWQKAFSYFADTKELCLCLTPGPSFTKSLVRPFSLDAVRRAETSCSYCPDGSKAADAHDSWRHLQVATRLCFAVAFGERPDFDTDNPIWTPEEQFRAASTLALEGYGLRPAYFRRWAANAASFKLFTVPQNRHCFAFAQVAWLEQDVQLLHDAVACAVDPRIPFDGQDCTLEVTRYIRKQREAYERRVRQALVGFCTLHTYREFETQAKYILMVYANMTVKYSEEPVRFPDWFDRVVALAPDAIGHYPWLQDTETLGEDGEACADAPQDLMQDQIRARERICAEAAKAIQIVVLHDRPVLERCWKLWPPWRSAADSDDETEACCIDDASSDSAVDEPSATSP